MARAAQLLDAADLLADRSAKLIDDAALEGRFPDFVERARVRADTASVAELVTQVIDKCLWIHGAGAFAEANRLQRIWRDSNVAARHGIVNPLVSLEAYGKALLGDERPITPFV